MNEFFFHLLNSLVGRSGVLDAIIYFLAQPLGLLMVSALLFYAGREILVERKGQKRSILLEKWALVFGAAIFAWILSGIIKDLMDVPRPFLALKDANLLFPHGDHDSFPSGHTTFIAAIGWALYFGRSIRLSRVFLIGATLIGVARVAAGIHWPLDILGGILLGFGAVWLAFKVKKYFE